MQFEGETDQCITLHGLSSVTFFKMDLIVVFLRLGVAVIGSSDGVDQGEDISTKNNFRQAPQVGSGDCRQVLSSSFFFLPLLLRYLHPQNWTGNSPEQSRIPLWRERR